MADEIARRWRGLMLRLGIDPGTARPVLDELLALYGETGRHYHTLDHVAALLHLLDTHGQGVTDRDAVELAIFFHDAVYDPARRDNEEASAALTRGRLAALGVAADVIGRVEQLILATRHTSDIADDDTALLVDLDLSVLAAELTVYAAYASAIRLEYAMYPDHMYRPGRKNVLSAFLARPQIYGTPALRALWEAPARGNLAWEVGELDGRQRCGCRTPPRPSARSRRRRTRGRWR